jgi:beta-galactosidase
MMRKSILMIIYLFAITGSSVFAQRNTVQENSKSVHPLDSKNAIHIGAQVFIEPGQSAEEIDLWFSTLKEYNFTICRIRMFESYMKQEDGTWDFELFDMAFRSAEKYGIKVYGTFFPYTEKTDIGGFKFPRDEAHLQSIAEYIKQLTTHFAQFSSLHGWVLINEPGVGGAAPDSEFRAKKFEEWKLSNPPKEYTEKGFPILVELTDQAFLLDYNTWFLNWIANEVHKYDTSRELHVNNHAIFQNCAEYDFIQWRKFLSSLGGSAHASWHFGYFSRAQYAVAMLANSEIIRSGAGDLPWIMTELQGGNNTYSGLNPMCPTKEEIAQWLWIVTATEGKGSIFWSLNPRSSGIEAGEWALLDFQNKASDRMITASEVAQTIRQDKELIENLKIIDSDINVLYVRQSLWAESKLVGIGNQPYEARSSGGVMKSALGYFEAITQMGLNANFKAFEEFDFTKSDYTGSAIILAHQISLPDSYAALLEGFVENGGKLIVEGLTAFFDENLHNTMKTGFAFEKLFGGNISEFKMIENTFPLQWNNRSIPAHSWRGYISNNTGDIAATHDGKVTAIRNRLGKGEVLWVPSLIGLGSRISGEYTGLIKFLDSELKTNLVGVPVCFKSPQKDMLMRTLRSGSKYVTVIINKSDKVINAELDFKIKTNSNRIVYANKSGKVKGNAVTISSEETMVIEWK